MVLFHPTFVLLFLEVLVFDWLVSFFAFDFVLLFAEAVSQSHVEFRSKHQYKKSNSKKRSTTPKNPHI